MIRATLFAMLSVPATAQHCAEPTFDDVLAAFQADEWAAARALTEAQVDHLAWTLMIPYLTGDSGGEDPVTLLDLQRRAVPGLLRRIDTDSTRSLVLARDGDVLTIVETRTLPDRVERVCRLASEGPPPSGTDPIDTAGFDGAPETLVQTIVILPEE